MDTGLRLWQLVSTLKSLLEVPKLKKVLGEPDSKSWSVVEVVIMTFSFNGKSCKQGCIHLIKLKKIICWVCQPYKTER